MRGIFMRSACLCLVIVLVVVGCHLLPSVRPGEVPFSQMEYVRPDVGDMDGKVEHCLELAEGGTTPEDLMEAVYDFYGDYSGYYTSYFLAYINYSIDTSDIYWSDEYDYCAQQGPVVDAAFDRLMYALADCPLREALEAEEYFGEGYFDAYDGEDIWTDAYKALAQQETELIERYYEISAQANGEDPSSEAYHQTYGAQLAQVYVELIQVRQQMAREAGYEDLQTYAYEYIYGRDFTPEEAEVYLEEIRRELVPLYEGLDTSGIWEEGLRACSTQETFDYVERTAQAMGGDIQEAFETMDRLGLYHIEYGENKLDTSFEVFLPDYLQPFVFVDPNGSNMDMLTFAHEFGHFCNDYVSVGTAAGIDVAEVFSQGMEYLSLSYGDAPQEMVAMKMADSLCVYVEQAAYAAFELAVYDLEGEDLTVENVEETFYQVGMAYGFDSWGFDGRMYVGIPHFFTDPGYVISYVVSNDAAMQLYQLEQEETGAGLERFQESLDTQQSTLLAYLEEAGLESPFAPGRIGKVRQTFEASL